MGENKVYRRRFNFSRNIKSKKVKIGSKKSEKSVDKMKTRCYDKEVL